jgi:cyclin-dependent kinase-like
MDVRRTQVVHRDIKPTSILLSEAGEVKLCDFGFARTTQCGLKDAQHMSTYVATRWYRAPGEKVACLRNLLEYVRERVVRA